MIVHHEVMGSGPPLVLANALGSTMSMWDTQLPALTGRFTVIRFDHRGHGGSSAPTGPYEIADLAGDVLAVLDDLGIEQAGYAGISLGGMIGIWLAAHAPERITSLGLLSTSAHLDPGPWRERITAVRSGGTAAVADATMEHCFSRRYRDAHPDHLDNLTATLAKVDDEAYIAYCEAIASTDLRGELAKISLPTLVMAGADDTITPPEHAREIADTISDTRMVVVSEVQHLIPVERPGAVSRRLLDHFRRTLGV